MLPPPTDASYRQLSVGADYSRQVYFDFETGNTVFDYSLAGWDIGFEAGAEGRHIVLNGGKDVLVYDTHRHALDELTELPANLSADSWQIDAPDGAQDSTGVGTWFDAAGHSNGEVYVIQTAPAEYFKMRLLSVSDTDYRFEWAPLSAKGTASEVVLPKDSLYNYMYYSFKGGIVRAEPPRAAWDIEFTYYRDLVYDNNIRKDVPYLVTGVLLNPAGTAAVMDSTHSFSDITVASAQALTPSTRRNIIGYDWKAYNFSTGHYAIRRDKNYILHTAEGQIYKMHFLDFYNSAGEKGNPSFEYLRLL